LLGMIMTMMIMKVLRKQTPKVLTISRGLSEITDNWEQELVDTSVSVEKIVKDDDNIDKDIAAFYEFMRQELGQEDSKRPCKRKCLTKRKILQTSLKRYWVTWTVLTTWWQITKKWEKKENDSIQIRMG
jgi:hypothetical protein